MGPDICCDGLESRIADLTGREVDRLHPVQGGYTNALPENRKIPGRQHGICKVRYGPAHQRVAVFRDFGLPPAFRRFHGGRIGL